MALRVVKLMIIKSRQVSLMDIIDIVIFYESVYQLFLGKLCCLVESGLIAAKLLIFLLRRIFCSSLYNLLDLLEVSGLSVIVVPVAVGLDRLESLLFELWIFLDVIAKQHLSQNHHMRPVAVEAILEVLELVLNFFVTLKDTGTLGVKGVD
jgi:hypothetical protein